jgi:hypothetical protein
MRSKFGQSAFTGASRRSEGRQFLPAIRQPDGLSRVRHHVQIISHVKERRLERQARQGVRTVKTQPHFSATLLLDSFVVRLRFQIYWFVLV